MKRSPTRFWKFRADPPRRQGYNSSSRRDTPRYVARSRATRALGSIQATGGSPLGRSSLGCTPRGREERRGERERGGGGEEKEEKREVESGNRSCNLEKNVRRGEAAGPYFSCCPRVDPPTWPLLRAFGSGTTCASIVRAAAAAAAATAYISSPPSPTAHILHSLPPCSRARPCHHPFARPRGPRAPSIVCELCAPIMAARTRCCCCCCCFVRESNALRTHRGEESNQSAITRTGNKGMSVGRMHRGGEILSRRLHFQVFGFARAREEWGTRVVN